MTKLYDLRLRVTLALHVSTSLTDLRQALILALADSAPDSAAKTMRSVPDYVIPVSVDLSDAPDSAPSVPIDSELGKEFGG